MSFEHYVDDLAKRGIIDGHIAEMLVGKHRDEASNPLKHVRSAIQPIIELMCEYEKHSECCGIEPDEFWYTHPPMAVSDFANEIDDAITKLENESRNAQ